MPSQQGGRFDTSRMSGGSPKWPIVLICALVVVIAVVVLLIFRPWDSGTPAEGTVSGGSGTAAVEPVGPDAGEADQDGAQDAGTVTDTPSTEAGALSDADAYAQLSAIYNQFAGFAQRIQEIVDYFNTAYPDGSDTATLQSWLDTANALRAELSVQTDALNAIQLAEGSAYVETLANLRTLNNDLAMRTADLADALQAWASGEGDVGAILTRSNGEDGVSVYKAEYESLYPNAAPVAPAEQ